MSCSRVKGLRRPGYLGAHNNNNRKKHPEDRTPGVADDAYIILGWEFSGLVHRAEKKRVEKKIGLLCKKGRK